MIGGNQVHELQGLSEMESWNLFQRMAFQAKERDDDLVALGKKIVKKCINVPLAIRVVESLLRGQSKSKWLSFYDKGLESVSERNDTLNRILKLSYDQLSPSLKTCFSYCAIFPKDWTINKQMLIWLWMAQGYIDFDNLGKEYFLIFLQRCFFQDVVDDEFGQIVCFKMHDLLHDIAEQVADDLSWSIHLKILPKSITKLVNLHTLDLHCCSRLENLPNDVSNLVDLSTLNVAGCDALSRMPRGIGMMNCLKNLGHFVVGVRGCSSSKQCFDGLEDLKHLNKLKGSLEIRIGVLKIAKFLKDGHSGGAYLRCMEQLKKIVIRFKKGKEYGRKEHEQALLEEMQPHHDIRKLELEGYHGETMPRWHGRGDNSTLFYLPNLVTLKIYKCCKLLSLPSEVAQLPHLKKLQLVELQNLEYVVNRDPETSGSGEGSSFSSLVELRFHVLPKLKGWWGRSESGLHAVNYLSF
ncbi:putative disease resistance protein RGA1 [Silene latifolia]|uniref:putative disease resistance protein RGA1 n=1 Tax=Silene latifolia TaxID=37657 RepID=UPI003D779F5E